MTTETLSEIQVSYKPGLVSSKTISNSKEAFDIMRQYLLKYDMPSRTICSALFEKSKKSDGILSAFQKRNYRHYC